MTRIVAMKCACCGGDMLPEKDIGDSIIYKCAECGLSDSRVKKKQEKRVDIEQEVTNDKRIWSFEHQSEIMILHCTCSPVLV